MKMRWVLMLLLTLNLAYLGWGLYRAHVPDSGREIQPLQRAPGVSDIRLIDSLADSPPPSVSGHPAPAAAQDHGQAGR